MRLVAVLFFFASTLAASTTSSSIKLSVLTQQEFQINDGKERQCHIFREPCGPVSDLWGSSFSIASSSGNHQLDSVRDVAIVGVLNGVCVLSLENLAVTGFVERRFLKGCLSERRDIKTLPGKSNIAFSVVDESDLCKCKPSLPCQRIMSVTDESRLFNKNVPVNLIEGSSISYQIEASLYYSQHYDGCTNSTENISNRIPIIQVSKCGIEEIIQTAKFGNVKAIILYDDKFGYSPTNFKVNQILLEGIAVLSVFKSDADFLIGEMERGNPIIATIDSGLFSMEASNLAEPDGLWVFDLKENKDQVSFKEWFDFAKNIFIESDRPYLYASGVKCAFPDDSRSCHEGLVVLDVTDPFSPKKVSEWRDNPIHAVDVKKTGSKYILLGSSIFEEKIFAFDVTTFKETLQLFNYFAAPPRTHSVAMSEDGNYAFIVHQVIGTEVSVWDIKDTQNIYQVASLPALSSPESLPHNMLVYGDRMYLTHFADGVAVFDISKPHSPALLTKYDTSPFKEGFHGAWGVYIFENGIKAFVSDIEQGVFAFEVKGISSEEPSLPIAQTITLIVGSIMSCLCGMGCMYFIFLKCLKKEQRERLVSEENGGTESADEVEMR